VTREPGLNDLAGDDDDEIWVQGTARSGADGSPIDIAMLDSGEFRDPLDTQPRLEPNEVVAGPDAGTYIAKYRAPFNFVKDPVSTSAALAALQRDGHAFGYGHVPIVDAQGNESLRPDAMLVEGMAEQVTPAPGCEGAPKEESSAGTTSTDVLNSSNLAPKADDDVVLEVGGWAGVGVTAADVVLTSGTTSAEKPVTLGDGGWTAEFTKADLAALAQGTVQAQLRVGGAGGTLLGAAKTIRYDTVAPAAPTTTPDAGAHTGRQGVSLSAETGARIYYTTDGSAPTTASTRFGAEIVLDRDTTVNAIAVDAAGNESPVASASFTIKPAVTPFVSVVPGLVELGASASPLPSVAPAAVTLKVARLTLPARMSAGAARRRGVVASFVTPAGAAYAEARLIRLQGAKRRLVGKRLMAATPGRRQVARFTTAAVRKQLATGRYVIEVRTGPSAGRLGPAVTMRLRVGG
jgi:hypothetical protein